MAGAAHSGWAGQEYRAPLSLRVLGAVPEYTCGEPPFSRLPQDQVISAAYDHLVRWVEEGVAPPSAPYLEFDAAGQKVRNELGLAQGGIQLSQVVVPTALNSGSNSGASFCRLFGTHQPFTSEQLATLYKNPGKYISAVGKVDRANVRAGYLEVEDARLNHRAAVDFAKALRPGKGGKR